MAHGVTHGTLSADTRDACRKSIEKKKQIAITLTQSGFDRLRKHSSEVRADDDGKYDVRGTYDGWGSYGSEEWHLCVTIEPSLPLDQLEAMEMEARKTNQLDRVGWFLLARYEDVLAMRMCVAIVEAEKLAAQPSSKRTDNVVKTDDSVKPVPRYKPASWWWDEIPLMSTTTRHSCNNRNCDVCNHQTYLNDIADRAEARLSNGWYSSSDAFHAANARAEAREAEYWSDLRHSSKK